MPPLTATPTNTLPDITRGNLCEDGVGDGRGCCRCCLGLCDADGLALVCKDGDGLALLREGGGVAGPLDLEMPLGRPSELA